MTLNKTLLIFVIFSIAVISCQEDKPITEGSTDLTYMPNDNLKQLKNKS